MTASRNTMDGRRRVATADARCRIRGCLAAILAACALGVGGAVTAQDGEQKFYPDDPLTAEPEPFETVAPTVRALSEILELASNTVGSPGERHPAGGVIQAQGVSTLGEVLDGAWFVNRHATQRLSREELILGSQAGNEPDPSGDWQILTLKPFGFRPGMLIADARRQLFLLLFDPPGSPELATGAQVVSSHIAHAIGYHVPESHIVTFEREQLTLAEGAEFISSAGNTRTLLDLDVTAFLRSAAQTALGRFRAVALYATPAGAQQLIGPYQVFATRSDDPNDVVPHEHRRDLRGFFVIASWLNHSTFRAVATADALIDDGVVPAHIRHYMIDFYSSLGSGLRGQKRAWEGNDRMFDGDAAFRNLIGFGFWSPEWMRARFPALPAVGRFEAEAFDPARWTPTERLAPFENRLPDDEYWGAKQVMAFTDDDIAALVSAGEYTDPEATEWIVRTLIARRDKIGRHYFAQVLPLDDFRVENGRVVFDDLAERYGVTEIPRTYTGRWLRVQNDSGLLIQMPGSESFDVPDQVRAAAEGMYYAVRIAAEGEDPERNVTVYFRTAADGLALVGIERGWPGKVLADPRADETGLNRYADLDAEQQELYAPFAEQDAAARGRTMTPEEHFDSQTVSERTTYEAVTHALTESELTAPDGSSLGRAFDLVSGIERVAGQYYGRGGDQQFRLYVTLHPGAVETLDQSVEFFLGHLNTVYHVGYPYSYRQEGDVPNMQISVSEDGNRADIDVDYRSSKSPQAMFNGHLTSANSDVRAGDNLERHNGRWDGLVGWWRNVFGNVQDGRLGPQDMFGGASTTEVPTRLPADRPLGVPIERPEDAIQEFLTDWLVRQEIEEALAFMSDRSYACVNTDDDAKYEALGSAGARNALRETLTYSLDQLQPAGNLTEAIDAVRPLNPDRVLIPHAFDGEFNMAELTPADAAQYLCGEEQGEVTGTSYHGVLFRFKHLDSGALGLLWTQESPQQWRLVSWQMFVL